MIVYKLTHRRYIEYKLHTGEPVTDNKLIGFFTSRDKAEATVDILREKPYFRDYPLDFFIDEYDICGNSDKVYLAEHSYYIEDDRIDNVVEIGAFSTESEAMAAAKEYEKIAEFPVGSHIWDEDFDIDNYLSVSEYELNTADWMDGFTAQ